MRLLLFATLATALATMEASVAQTSDVERCIEPAAQYHRVNHQVLRAILTIESGLKPGIIGKNANGTIDVGLGQINSMHFKELQRWGVTPSNLLDPCVASYVSAWQLRKAINQGGNTWEGIARYHSSTPYFNRRYQILLYNELVRSKVLAGPMLSVPPLKPGNVATTRSAASRGPEDAPLVVFDGQTAH